MKEIDKVALILIVDDKILSTKSKGKSVYYLPGGKREGQESDEQTLIREIKEELNVEIVKETIRYFGTFTAQSDGDQIGVNVKMTCYKADYRGSLKASNEIAEFRWLNCDHLDIISEVDKMIFKTLKESQEIK